MSAAFTPPPWRVEEDDMLGGCSFIPVADHRGAYLAEVTGTSENPAEVTDTDRANARLIAAAPAMHAFIEQIAQRDDDTGDEAKALLKLAEGSQ